MSIWWLAACGLTGRLALALAAPYAEWVPSEKARFQFICELMAKALLTIAIVLAYQIGQANP